MWRRNRRVSLMGGSDLFCATFLGTPHLRWRSMHFHCFAATAIGLAAYHSGAGSVGAIIVGAAAGSGTLLVGQIAFTALQSSLIRAAIAFLFTLPAAVAGYHAALGLAHIAVPAEGWQQAIAVGSAIIVAATAWARMAFSAPPDMTSLPA
jgi:hypothetical protein